LLKQAGKTRRGLAGLIFLPCGTRHSPWLTWIRQSCCRAVFEGGAGAIGSYFRVMGILSSWPLPTQQQPHSLKS
jgi:hypothetical protein